MISWKHLRMAAYGFAAGSVGLKLLASKDAKKVYTHVTAAVLRCADEAIKTATCIRENCEDIHADAVEINEERYRKEREQEILDAKAVLASAEEDLDYKEDGEV